MINPSYYDIQEEVKRQLNTLPSAYVPGAVALRLSDLPRRETLESLRQLAQSDDENLSDRAIRTVLQINPEYGKELLIDLSQKASWHWYFSYAALEWGDKTFIQPLCRVLRDSSDPTARYMAAVALERIGDLTAIPALTEALDDPGEDYEGRTVSTQAYVAITSVRNRSKD